MRRIDAPKKSGPKPVLVKNIKELTREPRKQYNRTETSLRRLGVTREQLAAAPDITFMLKRAEGGLTNVLRAMRLSQDELIVAFFRKYDSMPTGDRDQVPMEAIALSAGLNLNHLLGAIMGALQQQAVNTTKIIAVTNHPRITQARVEYGLLPLGERDRTALDTAVGFLPSPKSSTFIGKAIFGSGKSTMEQQQRGDDDDDAIEAAADFELDLDRLFPPANRMQEKLQTIRQRQLPAGDDSQKKPS